jgi:hypothetical protein
MLSSTTSGREDGISKRKKRAARIVKKKEGRRRVLDNIRAHGGERLLDYGSGEGEVLGGVVSGWLSSGVAIWSPFAVPFAAARWCCLGEGRVDLIGGRRSGVDLVDFEHIYTGWEGRTRTVSPGSPPGTTTTQGREELGDVESALSRRNYIYE